MSNAHKLKFAARRPALVSQKCSDFLLSEALTVLGVRSSSLHSDSLILLSSSGVTGSHYYPFWELFLPFVNEQIRMKLG